MAKRRNSSKDYLYYLKEALKQARLAEQKDEVPIGAVIVDSTGKIISRAHNLRESKKSALAHAECLAIEKATKKLKSWRLIDCELYVTLEPCSMCAGAIQQARIKKVFFGAFDQKAGVISLGIEIHSNPKLNHRFEMQIIESPECGNILTEYFKKKRSYSLK